MTTEITNQQAGTQNIRRRRQIQNRTEYSQKISFITREYTREQQNFVYCH